MRSVPTAAAIVAPFAERLLGRELPHVPTERQLEAIGVVISRVDVLPGVMRAGVLAIGLAHRILLASSLTAPVSDVLARLPLPLVGEYPRLVRSLAFAAIWERWPETPPIAATR